MGTSAGKKSNVYFTGGEGILTEVFIPLWITCKMLTCNF
nr:hypothetical protein [Cylindrospermopsis raciborskii]